MEYVTHLREDGSYQLLKEHLESTAKHSAKFAASFGASSHAKRTALLHDIGKYSPNGQRRQRDPEHTAKVDHSTAGAKAAADLDDMPAAFAIAGHHGGLPDLGTRLSLDDGTLCARLNKKLKSSKALRIARSRKWFRMARASNFWSAKFKQNANKQKAHRTWWAFCF